MTKHENTLDIVNENDGIIGSDTRNNIHEKGLIHREITVLIINDNKEIVLQRRSKGKIFFPGRWSLSASGHVELGDSYIFTAEKELEEETGIKVQEDELIFIDKIRISETWENEKMSYINNIFKSIYVYKFKNEVDKLTIEENEAEEFQRFKINELLNLDENKKKEFTPAIGSEKIQNILMKIQELI